MDALLLGADHPELGLVAARTPAPDLSIALTRGRHLKRYRYTDPNEDVVAVRRRGDRTALVVADGHSGHEASHAAVPHLLGLLDPTIPAWSRVEAVRAFHDVNERIRQARRPLSGEHRRSRTTLALAVVAPDVDGHPVLTHAAVGDSAVVVVRDGAVHQLTRDRQHFLGDALSPPLVAGAMDQGQTELEAGDVVVVLSDGYTNFAPLAAIGAACTAAADPEALARDLIDIAGEGGAGDNVAVGVLWHRTDPTDRT